MLFRGLNFINFSSPKTYIDRAIIKYMKILKVKSREYKGRYYYKYRIDIPEVVLKEANFIEGDKLKVETKNGEIKLRKI